MLRTISLFQKPRKMTRAAVIAITHGGGPMPVMGDPSQKEITKSLKERIPTLLGLGTNEAPRAIVVVTAHWLERNPTISNREKHELFYDYYGFPPETYNLKYNAPGSPEVATEVFNALKSEGFTPEFDEDRGWDHGVFIPFLLIEPAAKIPIVQLSILSSQDVSQHFAMGRALAKLRDDNIAIVGSGSPSFHNLRAMFSGALEDGSFKKVHEKWNKTTTEALSKKNPELREKEFAGWRSWPGAYDMHPRGGADHFMPLLVCAGAGGEDKTECFSDRAWGIDMLTYYWRG
ncbi:Extradiol ring-cleavage dioxygenase, class III enzyme, subunit B [Xylogone sp. PMI_703]|nr:Extradiol ring-cleavage dioxygenase, class III enzyme, subunit B [Xylogone sp. PMI_703]